MYDARFFAACGTVSIVAVCAAVVLHRPPDVRVVVTPPSTPVAAVSAAPVGEVLLEDSFDGENGGVPVLMYGRFAKWTVKDGTVDLIGRGSDWDFIPGHGLYVDLDGDRPDGFHFESGALVSREAFELAPGTYELRYRIAGSQRGDVNTTVVSIPGVFHTSVTLASEAHFETRTHRIVLREAATAHLRFENKGADGFGLLLDDVRLIRVSEAQ